MMRLHGQQIARRQLERALKESRIHHAYLLRGPRGVGKRLAATLFAQALLCERRSAPGSAVDAPPCGECRACRAVAQDRHPDVHVVEPAGAGIGIEQVRQLKQAVALKPHSGAYKLAIVDPADAMSVQAQNSLLKLLEEPPGSAVLMLLAHEDGGLLPTISSRCLSLRFAPLSADQVVARAEAAGADATTARLAAALAQGSYGRLDQLLALDIGALREEVLDDQSRLEREGRSAAMPIATRLAAASELPLRLELWLLWLSDLLIWPREAWVVNVDLAERLEATRARQSSAILALAHRHVATARRQLTQNVNTRILLDALTARLSAVYAR